MRGIRFGGGAYIRAAYIWNEVRVSTCGRWAYTRGAYTRWAYTRGVYIRGLTCVWRMPKVSDGMQHVRIAYLFLKYLFRKIYNFGNCMSIYVYIIIQYAHMISVDNNLI